MLGTNPTVVLDRPRPIRWTKRAEALNASLPRPASFAGLARRKHQMFALCAIIWASLTERDHPFEAPEDLAEYFGTPDQQSAALKAISTMVDEAFPEKKGDASSSSSGTGLAPSSSVSSEPPPPTGGR